MKKATCIILALVLLIMNSNWAYAADTNTNANTVNSPAVQSLDKQLTELEMKITNAQAAVKDAEDKYYQLLKNYTPYTIIGNVVSSGSDFIIVQGSALGGGFGLGTGYKKILNPDKNLILLNTYTGMHFFLRTENDLTYGTMNVYDNGPAELQQAKTALDNAKKLLESLNSDKIALVEKKNGIKEIHFANGDYYKGTLNAEGKFHGNGKIIWASGSTYEGGWSNGKREGKGKMTFSNGDVYEGEFKNDLYDGYGKLKTGYHPEGTQLGSYVPAYYNYIYTGDFKEGKFNGKGTLIHNPDPIAYAFGADRPYEYVGELKNGVFDGYGTLMDEGRAVLFEGTWQNGEPVKSRAELDKEVEPKKWYEQEYTEKISDTYSKYTDGGIGYTAIYPTAWGKPKVQYMDSIPYGVTEFYSDGSINITAYVEYCDKTNKEEYLENNWFNPGVRKKVKLKSGYEAYTFVVGNPPDNIRGINYVIMNGEKVVRIRMTIYDNSKSYWKDLSKELTEMINTIEFTPGVG